MKLQTDALPVENHQYVVTAYGDAAGQAYLDVNRVRYQHGLLLLPTQLEPWDVTSLSALTEDSLNFFLEHELEVVLLGTGARQQLPHQRLMHKLAAKRIGVEVMDTRAACRTYNILLSEGRQVAAALIL